MVLLGQLMGEREVRKLIDPFTVTAFLERQGVRLFYCVEKWNATKLGRCQLAGSAPEKQVAIDIAPMAPVASSPWPLFLLG